MFVGIEIGGTKLQAGVCLANGELRRLDRRAIERKKGRLGILKELQSMIPPLLREYEVRAIGIGFGGPVDTVSGRVVKSHQVSGWQDFKLRQWAEKSLGVPVILENDANAAAFAEAAVGAGRGKRSVFYITVGTGIGAGFILDGVIYNGKLGAAEIGHTFLQVDKRWRSVESLASGLAIEQGRSTLAHSGRYVGAAIANAVALLNPDIVVVGGGVALAGEKFFRPLRTTVKRLVFPPFSNNFRVVPSLLGEAVVVVGAALLAEQQLAGGRTIRTVRKYGDDMSKTALLFSGQGAQTVGMGKDLYEKFEVCRNVYDTADRILGRSLSAICFQGPEAELTKTVNAQPGLFVTSLACLEALKWALDHRGSAGEQALKFDAMAGLSLGEFTALTAAGAMSFEDGLKIVQQRGQFMQEACDATSGTMASVMGMDEAACAAVCSEADVDMANLNCPGQIVISGEKDKIAKAIELAKTRGAKRALPLNVAGAYHSRLMTTAQEKLEAALKSVSIHTPKAAIVANVSAGPVNSPEEIRTALVRQVTGSVRWEDSMRWLAGQGFTRFIELGPGGVLAGLMKRINKDLQVLSVGDAPSLEDAVNKLIH